MIHNRHGDRIRFADEREGEESGNTISKQLAVKSLTIEPTISSLRPVHTSRNLKTQQSPVILDLCSRKLGKGNQITVIVFEKAPF